MADTSRPGLLPGPQQVRQQRRRASLLGVLALGALLVVLFRCEPLGRTSPGGGDRAASAGAGFGIAGDTTQAMSPGRLVRIDLTLTNPEETAMTVSGLTVAVSGVSAPRADPRHPCSVDDFVVEQPGAGLRATIPAEVSRSLSSLRVPRGAWPQVGLADHPTNQDGCKDALVELSYSGSATLED